VRELERRREQAVTESREEAQQRNSRAEMAERQARIAEQEAARERAEANLHEERAALHERGLADHELIGGENDELAGTGRSDDAVAGRRGEGVEDVGARRSTGTTGGETYANRDESLER